jgi:dTDP-4-dehydrorhamnose 3,5-epimerase
VDVRRGSPDFGKWTGERLSSTNHKQLYVPPGFAHGFLVLSDYAVFAYKCTNYYRPEREHVVRWDDPAIGIQWPAASPALSERDARAPRLADIPVKVLPAFGADSAK